jgi:hypothetical protein
MKIIRIKLILFATLSALSLGMNAVHAQTTVFTYQGRVLDNGTNFNGTGQFKFALVTSTNFNHQATATANLSGTFVTSYNIISGGSGYVSAPTVTVSGGGGSGATATAVITGGVVTQINPGSAGSGYTSTPTVTLSAPPANIAYTTYWSNDGTGGSNGGEPTSAVGVGVTNGLFTVALGDTTLGNMTAISTSLFAQPNLQLQIWFNDGVSGFAALSPVQNLTPSPYAIFADSASNALTATTATTASTASAAAANAVNTAAIQNSAVTAAKIASGQVVKSLNGLQDAVTLSGGNNVTITPSGQTLSIAAGGWSLTGNSGTTPGVNYVGTTDNQPLELHVNGSRALRLEPAGTDGAPNVIGGSLTNSVDSGIEGAVIAGGGATNSPYSTPCQPNHISSSYSVIGGGEGNTIQSGAALSTVVGGGFNTISNSAGSSTISGGQANVIQSGAVFSCIGGGVNNTNLANADYATIPGGLYNVATIGAFAAGYRAKATNQGAFVWSDFTVGYDFNSTNNNEFAVRCNGGARFVTQTAGNQIYAGVWLAPAGSSWASISDRNAKKDITPIDTKAILNKLAQVPICQWHYKWESDATTLNIGPMAQDFVHAFYPGRDDKSITTLEYDGVELAAIQGLNQKVEEKDAEIQALKARLEKLEQSLETKNGGGK